MPPANALKNDHCQECTETCQTFLDASGSFMTWDVAAGQPAARPAISLLTVAAWRYYLPTFLIWCVRDTIQADVLVDTVAHTLSRRSDSQFEERSRGFSRAQREAIALFLEWHQEWQLAEGFAPGEGPLRHTAKGIAFWRSDG
jgi:hypothetical protein